ncbi:MAG: UMP kinase [Chloroflexi bacterium]|nr:UMP kinase [Chloroflexota bacterium]
MTANEPLPYERVLLKLSGEALAGDSGMGIDPDKTAYIAQRVHEVYELGIQVAIVIGGGNLWRGEPAAKLGMDRSTADHMGMIATVMNGLALQDAIERLGIVTRVQTAVEMNSIAEPYIRLRAIRHLEKGRVVILSGGIGSPYFTTDSAAALRASEIHADVIVKATKVDGVYSADPVEHPRASRFSRLSYQEVLDQQLRVMDTTAFTLCQENMMPIIVLDFWNPTDLVAALRGDVSIGTLISELPGRQPSLPM